MDTFIAKKVMFIIFDPITENSPFLSCPMEYFSSECLVLHINRHKLINTMLTRADALLIDHFYSILLILHYNVIFVTCAASYDIALATTFLTRVHASLRFFSWYTHRLDNNKLFPCW